MRCTGITHAGDVDWNGCPSRQLTERGFLYGSSVYILDYELYFRLEVMEGLNSLLFYFLINDEKIFFNFLHKRRNKTKFKMHKETGSGVVRMTCTYKCGEDFPYPDDTYDVEYTIRCFKDTSRYDVTEPCKIDITPKNLKNFIDEDQSRYIGDDKYYVVDLYKIGKLNAWQRKRLCQLMLDVNKGERYPYSSTLYYTDKNEWGIWDYMKAKPIKMLRE